MNYRPANFGNSYTDQGNRLGYSSVSKNYGYSNRSTSFHYIDFNNDDQNFGEIEFMLENERKKFK